MLIRCFVDLFFFALPRSQYICLFSQIKASTFYALCRFYFVFFSFLFFYTILMKKKTLWNEGILQSGYSSSSSIDGVWWWHDDFWHSFYAKSKQSTQLPFYKDKQYGNQTVNRKLSLVWLKHFWILCFYRDFGWLFYTLFASLGKSVRMPFVWIQIDCCAKTSVSLNVFSRDIVFNQDIHRELSDLSPKNSKINQILKHCSNSACFELRIEKNE